MFFRNIFVWEPPLPWISSLDFNLASITAAENWAEVHHGPGWKNDAWNTCSGHDTNQMNGVFTYSDNKIALERNSTAAQEGSFYPETNNWQLSDNLDWDMVINRTRRGITQCLSFEIDCKEKVRDASLLHFGSIIPSFTLIQLVLKDIRGYLHLATVFFKIEHFIFHIVSLLFSVFKYFHLKNRGRYIRQVKVITVHWFDWQ